MSPLELLQDTVVLVSARNAHIPAWAAPPTQTVMPLRPDEGRLPARCTVVPLEAMPKTWPSVCQVGMGAPAGRPGRKSTGTTVHRTARQPSTAEIVGYQPTLPTKFCLTVIVQPDRP